MQLWVHWLCFIINIYYYVLLDLGLNLSRNSTAYK